MSIDPFASPKRRVARAKRHIANLNARIDKFFKKHPYAQVTEKEADGATDLHKIKLLKPLPNSMSDLASDIIEDLRSALRPGCFRNGSRCRAAGRQVRLFSYRR